MTQHQNDKVRTTAGLNEKFHPIILQRGDGFCIYLPELNVSGEGKSLDEAYQQYELNKKALESRAAKYGLATLSLEPYPTLQRGAIFRELGLFFLKVATSAFAVVLVVILLLPNIGAAFRNQVTALVPAEFRESKYWAIRLPAQLNARLDRLKPEEEQQMREEWNRLLIRTTPILSPLTCGEKSKEMRSR